MNKKISLLFLLSGACLASCGGGGSKPSNTHTVTWNLNNGEVIRETYNDGDTPTFKSGTPTKADGEIIENYYQLGYLFTGWKDEEDQDLHPVTEDVEYFAQYEEKQVVTRLIVPTSEITNKTIKFNYEGTCEAVSWDSGKSLETNVTPDSVSHTFNESLLGDYQVISIFGNVKSIALSEGGYPLENNNEILCIILGSHINTIHSHAYSRLTKLNTVYLPASLTQVESEIASYSDETGKALVFYLESDETPTSWDENWAAVTVSPSTKYYTTYHSVHAIGFDNGYTYVSLNYNGYEELAITGFYYKVDFTGELVVPLTENINGKIMPVTALVYESFKDVTNLKQIRLPETIGCIGKNSFKGCIQLMSVQASGDSARPWPSNLEIIEESAFEGCSNLKLEFNFTYSQYLKTIGKSAFRGSGITKFIAGMQVSNIEPLAFSGASSLAEVDLHFTTKLKKLSDSLFESTNLKKFAFPTGVEEIGSRTFANAISQNFEGGVIVLPHTLTKIGSEAFKGLPEGVALDATAYDAAKKIPEGSLDMLTSYGSNNTIYIKDENLKQAFLDKQWPQNANYVTKS